MTSERQIASNRRNAKHSTGPRTEEGKRKSSLNSFKHGLSSENFAIDGEDPALIEQGLSEMIAAYGAVTTDELFLVERIFHSNLLAQRARYNLKEYFFVIQRNAEDMNRSQTQRYIDVVPLITRYLVQHERSAERANEMFYRNRKLRRTETEPPPGRPQLTAGFVPRNEKPGVRQLLNLVKPEPTLPPIA